MTVVLAAYINEMTSALTDFLTERTVLSPLGQLCRRRNGVAARHAVPDTDEAAGVAGPGCGGPAEVPMEWLVTTADGRTLAVEEAGDPDGLPVMVHVGTPNSRHLYGRTVADAAARGTLRENRIGEVHAWLADRLVAEPAT
jgi:hypothetical protein